MEDSSVGGLALKKSLGIDTLRKLPRPRNLAKADEQLLHPGRHWRLLLLLRGRW